MSHFRIAMLSALAVSALAVAGCNKEKGVEAKNESVQSVANKVAASNIRPQPGKWQSTVKMESLDMPGVPPQVKEAMTRQMASARTFTSCLTPEQVDQPNGGFFAGGAEGCTYKTFTMAGGRIDADMVCDHGGGMKQAMQMSGTYSETSYDIKMQSQSEVQPGTPMKMSVAVTSQRQGDCDGKEDITAKDVKEMQDFAAKHAKK